MMKMPHFLRTGFFALGLMVLSFFLKALCPISQGCFADPFVIAFFAPVKLLYHLAPSLGPAISLRVEQAVLVLIWFAIGCLVGLAADAVSRKYGKGKKPI